MKNIVGDLLFAITVVMLLGCMQDEPDRSGIPTPRVEITHQGASTDALSSAEREVVEAEKRLEVVEEENQERVHDAEVAGDADEVEEEKIEATKRLAEAEKEIDEKQVEATRTLAATE